MVGAVAAACTDVPAGTVTRPYDVTLQWHGTADARRLANWATDYEVLTQESIAALPETRPGSGGFLLTGSAACPR